MAMPMHKVEPKPILEPLPRQTRFQLGLTHSGFPVCQRCGGQLIGRDCLMCGTRHDERGVMLPRYKVVGYDYYMNNGK